MANKVRPKMDRSNRAKQFMPFDALTGFREALREKERISVEQRELSEEMKARLDEVLRGIGKGSMVTVEYFEAGEYVQVTGLVSAIDFCGRTLTVVNQSISFEVILNLTETG